MLVYQRVALIEYVGEWSTHSLATLTYPSNRFDRASLKEIGDVAANLGC